MAWSMEISKTGIRGLERYAKKYGIDYAIRKDTSEVPPRYLVFFKAPDAEAFNSAFKEYSASLLNKDKRPSVLARLQELVQAAAELPGKVRHKEQEKKYICKNTQDIEDRFHTGFYIVLHIMIKCIITKAVWYGKIRILRKVT